MEAESVLNVVISSGALVVSLVALYFSHFRQTSKGLLFLVEKEARKYLGNVYGEAESAQDVKDATHANLKYAFSNVGNQNLLLQHVAITKTAASNVVEQFNTVLPPGEIKTFDVAVMLESLPVYSVDVVVATKDARFMVAKHWIGRLQRDWSRNSIFAPRPLWPLLRGTPEEASRAEKAWFWGRHCYLWVRYRDYRRS